MKFSDKDSLLVLDGTVSHFQWAPGHENLLEKFHSEARSKSIAAGFAAATFDMYGILASSSMIATYEGEYTENFACVVNEKVVYGMFCGARKLQNGDKVKVVVSPAEEGDIFLAHAVQRQKDELLWLPSHVYCGDRAASKEYFRSFVRTNVVCWILLLLILGATVLLHPRVTWMFAAVVAAVMLFALPVLVWVGDYLLGRIGKEFGQTGSRIFRVLGFPDPDNLNMIRADFEGQTDEPYTSDIYMYRLALDAHANGTEIRTRFAREIGAIAERNEREKRRRKATRSGKAA
jgi:hypothetical protein